MAKIIYGLVDAKARTMRREAFEIIEDAEVAVGLKPGAVDHGTIRQGLGVVVDEYGLFEPAGAQVYFKAGQRLYAGNAVLYCYDEAGKTVDFIDATIEFVTAHEAEKLIRAGKLDRPSIAFNGQTKWKWPNPAPRGFRA